jgi:PEP-CTERM motif
LEGDLKKLLKISAVAMLALFAGCDRDTNEGTSAGSSYVGGHSKPVSVPEPGSLVLAGVGIVALGAFWRRGRRATQKQGDPTQKSRRDQDVSIRS